MVLCQQISHFLLSVSHEENWHFYLCVCVSNRRALPRGVCKWPQGLGSQVLGENRVYSPEKRKRERMRGGGKHELFSLRWKEQWREGWRRKEHRRRGGERWSSGVSTLTYCCAATRLSVFVLQPIDQVDKRAWINVIAFQFLHKTTNRQQLLHQFGQQKQCSLLRCRQ